MDTTSVAYVLCRIEDDSSLTPVSEHEGIVDGVAAGKHQVEVEDFDFSYGLFADGVKVASFAVGRPVNTEAAREVASVTADGVVAAQTPRQGTVGS